MEIINTEKLHIKSWATDLEDGALKQAYNLARVPFAYRHIALMPDCHQGYGMPIGGVMATHGQIIPNAVGVDIGCGMCSVKTSLTDIDTETLKKIMGEIRKVVPVGFKKHKEAQDLQLMPALGAGDFGKYVSGHCEIVDREWDNALKSLGTLGGGNHFIEIQKGSDGHIWIMIHSGSRNLGKQVADHYNKLAVELNKKWHSVVPKHFELAHLPIDSEEGQAYIKEMNYCVDYALANRKLMMDRVIKVFDDHFLRVDASGELVVEHNFDPMINIAHNYAVQEHYFGKDVWVHRKGATLAREGTIGIIPGSQGTKSYIVKGLGNKDSFDSCSHGAGRRMGRKQAIRELSLKAEIKALDDKGVIHSIRNAGDLDEAPSAYKDVEQVMKNQEDLVEILVTLSPLGVIKG
jgi:tRNA-splicing ligase RtcB (3'-phosphate/5'-hydroxy nucleic acid ligase)